ncbi:MAG: hypothetical protein ABIH63_03540 [archaeon]
MALVICIPLTLAADTQEVLKGAEPEFKSIDVDEFEERETGESIVVEVKSYEPQVLVASAIEQDDVPVFVFLTGTTLGSYKGPEFVSEGRLTVVKEGDIFYGVPPIKNVYISERDYDSKYVRSVTYKKPKNSLYSLDNLGYLIVNLKQIPKEADVPNIIDANMTVRIEFDMERSYGIGRQTLILSEEANEKTFLNKVDLRDNMVFSGNAYVRAVKISDDSVDIMVYDTALKGLGSRTNLKVGQISSAITLRGTHSNLVQDQFRLQVDSIVDPQREYAEVEVSIDGSLPEKKILYKGSTLYPGSSVTVSDVSKIASGKEIIESVRVAATSGTYIASRNYTSKYNILNAEMNKEAYENKIYKNGADLQEVLKISNFKFDDLKNAFGFDSITFDPITVNALTVDQDYKPTTVTGKVKTLASVLSDLKLSPEIVFDEANKKVIIKIFKIAERELADPCTSQDLVYTQTAYYNEAARKTLMGFFDKEGKLSNQEKKRLLCSAIDVFKRVSASYGNEMDENNKVRYGAEADYMIGKGYDELSKLDDIVNGEVASTNALNYYRRAQSAGFITSDIQTKIEEFSTNLVTGVEGHDIVVDDNGHEVIIHLLQVVDKTGAQLDASARISVNNKAATVFRTGESLFPGEPKDMDRCRIKEIKSSSVIVENCPKHDKDGNTLKDTALPDITLKENVLTTIENYRVILLGTEINKQATVTVLPGSGKSMFSESSFMLHIPVEKRAIKLNPDKIDDKINKTEETIKKLNEIITNLDKLIKSWKAVCLATFAFLTIKNSFGLFGGGAARVRARERVMVDSGWRKYCETDSGPGKTYKSYDECIFEHADKINQNIDAVQKALESADNSYAKGSDNAAGVDIKGIKDFQKSSGEELYSEENFKNLVYLKELNDACSSGVGSFGNDAKGKPYPNTCADVSKKYSDALFEIQSANTNLGGALTEFKDKKLDSFEAWKKEHKEGALADFLNERTSEVNKLKSESQFKTYVGRTYNSFTTQNKAVPAEVIKASDNNYYWVTPYGTAKVVPEADGKTYTYTYDNNQIKLSPTPQTADKTLKVSSVIWDASKTTGTAYNPDGISYKVAADSKGRPQIQDGPFKDYVATTYNEAALGDYAGLRQTYSAGASYECYEDNRPYCIPLSKGNFVKVLEFYKDGSPKTMNIWNVGPDGRLCTEDDVPAAGDPKYSTCAHTSALMTNSDCSRVLSEVQSKINSATRYCQSKNPLRSEDGHTFKHSISSAAQESYSKAGHCEDAMEIEDCKLMFAVCDPVMCPPSRFNLAGNWQVDDVTKTGIIGSIVLGLPNFPTDPIPICLTGISAGLKNIRSVFEAYRDCLVTMKVEGKSVGICDKIRSVYICQILWQEAIAIFKVKGGLLDVVGGMFGNAAGGGEYFSFSDNFANVEKSVNYFTQSYASSVFAAHKGKSLDEVGTEICKSAVYGQFPGLGEYFDHLTEPENPPQFTALFEEMPYSETEKKSQYSVYYHIYAGTDVEVQYSVYLKSPTNRKYYVTEQCERRNRKIEKGSFADYSITCVTDTGYTQICVEINGKEDCGFGKVSTAFSLNYLNDMVVSDEAKRQITKAEDCVPESPRTSPSLGSVALPGQVSLLRTGIVRVCSFDNPGKGANYRNWQQVGTCIDKDGKSWGSCWMDMSTVDITSVSERSELQKELESRGIQLDATKKGIPESALLKADASKEKIQQAYDSMLLKTWPDYLKSLALLQEVVDLSIDPNSIADALYKIGVIYYELALTTPTAAELKEAAQVVPPSTSTITTTTPEVKKEAEICYDKKDNDGDGWYDCEDQDCDGKYAVECTDASDCVNAPVCNYERRSACVCTSGLCCDLENCDFYSSINVCDIQSAYECRMRQSGDEIHRTLTMTYCTGKSSQCDGDTVVGEPELFKTCGLNEECRRGEPECYPLSK